MWQEIYNIQKSGIEVALANSVTPLDGKWKISADLQSATFYPIGNMVEGEKYRVTVFGGDSSLLPDPNTQITVKNVYGKTLTGNVYGYFVAGQEDGHTLHHMIMFRWGNDVIVVLAENFVSIEEFNC